MANKLLPFDKPIIGASMRTINDIISLRKKINNARHDYYKLDRATVSDSTYDIYMQTLTELERLSLSRVDTASPSQSRRELQQEPIETIKHRFKDPLTVSTMDDFNDMLKSIPNLPRCLSIKKGVLAVAIYRKGNLCDIQTLSGESLYGKADVRVPDTILSSMSEAKVLISCYLDSQHYDWLDVIKTIRGKDRTAIFAELIGYPDDSGELKLIHHGIAECFKNFRTPPSFVTDKENIVYAKPSDNREIYVIDSVNNLTYKISNQLLGA